VKLSELAERLGCELVGDGETQVASVAGLETAGDGDLSFLASPRFAPHLKTTRAAAVIVAPGQETSLPRLVSDDPQLAFTRAIALLRPPSRPAPGVHLSAQVHPTAVLGDGVHVGALAVVGARARIGARTVLHPHVVIYEDAVIGEDCILHSAAQVRERCRLGDRVVVQNAAVIGADGFGFTRDGDGHHQKFPQVGIVVIEDDVEIGALTAVDRAALAETRIGCGTKLDNLVQVGHSVTIAGQVGVADHVQVGDDVIATAQTGIPSNVEPKTLVSGYPAIENRAWLKSSAVFARLPELQRRLRELERKLESLLAQLVVPR
jgi:UDP-3-O-[3-hydroxymyristoyl] glucosamine N-acyltransferase